MMILYPNAKINIGLQVLGKRTDGYHNLESLMVPVGLSDILEIIAADENSNGEFYESGLVSGATPENNLCFKAIRAVSAIKNLPQLKVALHKQIPNGAGLGGGSSDAAFTLNLLNDLFNLGFTRPELTQMALEIGSDCPFFINNQPAIIKGRGEINENVELNHGIFDIAIIKPPFKIDTSLAYQQLKLHHHHITVKEAVQRPVNEWKSLLYNDFESIQDGYHQEIFQIKQKLYDAGAIFASMSGSGSAVFGLFDVVPGKLDWPTDYFSWYGKVDLSTKQSKGAGY